MQQRHVSLKNINIRANEQYDVIILGTGIAGLFTALNINEKWNVLLVTKAAMKANNSSLAQGGIATSRDGEIHYQDTINAGVSHNDIEAVKILTNESHNAIQKLIQYGVNFDKDQDGNLLYTREGGHTQRNVLHVKDETGKSIINTLSIEVNKRTNIQVIENLFVKDILTYGNEAKGIVAINNVGNNEIYLSSAVVIATGGIGRLYLNTTNEEGSNGDGIAMAYRAGAKLKDMEFIQFHPTAMYQENSKQRFLISEAVRGEGGILRNTKGEAFMEKYHKMKDLAPRDIVAKAIVKEIKDTKHPCVYLDITHQSEDYIKNRFPMIYNKCISFGVDMTKEWIPVAPAEHYIMGGIDIDLEGRTNIENLFACGECACTGVHGANRLASNSLLEGVVFSERLAKNINTNLNNNVKRDTEKQSTTFNEILESYINSIKNRGINQNQNQNQNVNKNQNKINLNTIEKQLNETMNKYVSIVRTTSGLMKAENIVNEIMQKLVCNHEDNIRYYQLINMAIVAQQVIEAAYGRREGIGAHCLVEETENREDLIC